MRAHHFHFAYAISPIDNWLGWHDPEQVFLDAPGASPAEEYDERLSGWDAVRAEAEAAVRLVGWEGDGNFSVMILPEPCGPGRPILAVKQSNNGDTFIATPVELPWLEGINLMDMAFAP